MSNRSLAAARNRRSPQEVVSDTSMKKGQQMPPQKRPQSGPPQSGISSMPSSSKDTNSSQNGSKLSISDVIGLITIRLSKLESHMIKEQTEPNVPTSTAGGVSDVDTVLRSLVSRVFGLEKSTEDVKDHLGDLDGAVKERLDNLSTAVKELEKNPESFSGQPDPALLTRIEKTEKEVSELKQLVIRLQTMLIETTMAAKMAPTQAPVYMPLPPSPPAPIEDTPGSMSLSI
jgi:hypothetical protein